MAKPHIQHVPLRGGLQAVLPGYCRRLQPVESDHVHPSTSVEQLRAVCEFYHNIQALCHLSMRRRCRVGRIPHNSCALRVVFSRSSLVLCREGDRFSLTAYNEKLYDDKLV